MASDPAFLFYPNDFIGGTMGMTLEEKGAYVELLMAQFNRGHFSDLMATRIIGESLWAVLRQKFTVDESGCYYNKRLEIEVNKRKAYSESRRNNLSGNKDKQLHMEDHMDTHMDSHMATHMEAHMENRNIYRKIGGAGGKKTKQTKHHYGTLLNVLLTDEERLKLIEQFGEQGFMDRIENLGYYISSKGDKYKSHYGTILNWERKNASNPIQQTPKQTGGNQFDRLRAE